MTLTTDTAASYKLLSAELQDRGYTVSIEEIDGETIATYTSPSGGVWQTPAAHIHYPFTSSDIKRLSIDKARAYKFAESCGVPIPFTLQINEGEEPDRSKLSSVMQLHSPLIVKPNDSSLSKGLTMGINDVETLLPAIADARSVKQSDVLIQQQVSGEEIRFIVVKGKVRAALLRQTPRVIGDGVKSVKELIEDENTLRQTLVFPYISYPQLTSEIIDAELLESNYVPEQNETFELSRATMIKNGCSVFEILNEIHPSYVQQIEQLSSGLDAAFFVADFLIKDHTSPLEEDNHWFLEFNVSPVLKLCYGCRDGKMFDIVPIIADLIEESIN